MMATVTQSPAKRRTTWRRVKRFMRRYREVIMIVAVLLMSLGFLFFGYIAALMMESAHASWFGRGY